MTVQRMRTLPDGKYTVIRCGIRPLFRCPGLFRASEFPAPNRIKPSIAYGSTERPTKRFERISSPLHQSPPTAAQRELSLPCAVAGLQSQYIEDVLVIDDRFMCSLRPAAWHIRVKEPPPSKLFPCNRMQLAIAYYSFLVMKQFPL